ncbi:unnamed protein product [Meloidogyne enterolobii]|uniref:Uncharacterized protein n=1 Tax=Meloidogyne enterolobii TaxID=390850 RepID=A0ACB1A141_MELEN
MFPWFPFVFPQASRSNRRTREHIPVGAFIEVRVVSSPGSIGSSESSFKASETSESSRLQICYKMRSAEDVRTKANETILMPNSNSHSTELIDSRKACSSTIPRKPVDNLNAQFFCEKSTRQDDLKKNIFERQSSLNDENKQETTNDENKESSKKVGGYTRPKTSKRYDFY